MTVTQRKFANAKACQDYVNAVAYCGESNIRLSRDPIAGYWLHFDGKMRFVQSLSDVRGTVDWINWTP